MSALLRLVIRRHVALSGRNNAVYMKILVCLKKKLTCCSSSCSLSLKNNHDASGKICTTQSGEYTGNFEGKARVRVNNDKASPLLFPYNVNVPRAVKVTWAHFDTRLTCLLFSRAHILCLMAHNVAGDMYECRFVSALELLLDCRYFPRGNLQGAADFIQHVKQCATVPTTPTFLRTAKELLLPGHSTTILPHDEREYKGFHSVSLFLSKLHNTCHHNHMNRNGYIVTAWQE